MSHSQQVRFTAHTPIHTPIHTSIHKGSVARTRGVAYTAQIGSVHRTYVVLCRVLRRACRGLSFFEAGHHGLLYG